VYTLRVGVKVVVEHYYSKKPSTKYYKTLISDVIRGVPVEFYVAPGVFSKGKVDYGTRLLIEVAVLPDTGTVLDVGAGYGVIGITIAKLNPKLRVYMVEINRRAYELCLQNIKLNDVEDRVTVLLGDLYEPVKNLKFDMIISNPPYSAGMYIVEKLIVESKNYLNQNSTLQIVAKKGQETVKNLMLKTFGNVEILARKSGYKVFMSVNKNSK